ncbi:MAG: DegV family protein [Candidatus Enteromonas sp.]|nr:DegV family protein [Candidatus Enteromonas sp.]
MPVKVITDSASNLTKEMLEAYGIDMVSFTYRIGEEVHLCYDPTLSYEEAGKGFYDALRSGANVKTSLCTPGDYEAMFRRYLEQGYDIFYTSISSKLSGSLNSASTAKDILLEEFPDRKIACVDSLSASFGEGIIAMEAAKLAKAGKTLEEIVQAIEPIRLNVRNEFTVDDLVYLMRGGRISKLLFALGKVLDIKPMLRASKEAEIESCGKMIGRRRALVRLAQTVGESIVSPETQTLYVAHCDCKEDAERVAELIRAKVPNLRNIEIAMYDFCTGAHVGPGAIAVFYFGTPRP